MEARDAIWTVDVATLALGRSNARFGERGWQEGAWLYSNGEILLGAGKDYSGAGIFRLAPVEDVRQRVLQENQVSFDLFATNETTRRLWYGNLSAEGYQSLFGPDKRPTVESMFTPIPPELVDSQGRAFISERGESMFDHPLYPELLGQKGASEIEAAVTAGIGEVRASLR